MPNPIVDITDMSTNRIINLGDPTLSKDAVNKDYVDNRVNHLTQAITGDGATTSFVFTHNVGTKAVIVYVFGTLGTYVNRQVFVDVTHTSINAVTITFPVAPPIGDNYLIIVCASGILVPVESAVITSGPGPRLILRGTSTLSAFALDDVAAGQYLHYFPMISSYVPLYDGSAWAIHSVGSGIKLSLGSLQPYRVYDVFVYDNSGILTLELEGWRSNTVTFTNGTDVVNWTSHGLANGTMVTFSNSGGLMPTGLTSGIRYYVINSGASTFQLATVPDGTAVLFTTDGTGTTTCYDSKTRATALILQDGRLVKTGSVTRLYVGTILASGTTTSEDTASSRWVWNWYNRVLRHMSAIETTNSWTYTTAAWRQANATAANAISYLCGLPSESVAARVQIMTQNDSNANFAVGVGVDATTTNSAQIYGTQTNSGYVDTIDCEYRGNPGVGYHVLSWIERSQAAGTTTWYGDAGDPSNIQAGIVGEVWT